MLFRVEALLESLSEAGTAVDLATQAAFKDLRTRTLKQQQEAFAAKAGKPTKKIEWGDVSLEQPAGRNEFTALVLTCLRCATARGGEDWRSRTCERWCVEKPATYWTTVKLSLQGGGSVSRRRERKKHRGAGRPLCHRACTAACGRVDRGVR